ncbi:MAG: Asp-tRNA(Asn)/Glu-tRNA(Gln) amidotransferase subunit GatC [Oscillospiraceae bacterium]|nr:Asp-tRNA(Asn)/Glu-tRNA(Gln) amidotransferase subunit GatC [Oscillospiraceae bacterium]
MGMTIDDELIQYLEELSKLRLTPAEQAAAKEDLGKILGYMQTLSTLDTEGVEGLSHPLANENVFREDAARPSAARETILGNAPRQKDGCFVVPKTVE